MNEFFSSPAELGGYIDHTLLKPEATADQIAQICREARENNLKSVCVNSCWTAFGREQLEGSSVGLAVVRGFPLGAMAPEAKAAEAALAVRQGAVELDMVLNVGYLKSGKLDDMENDIRGVVAAAGPGVVVKVILETCLLSEEEIVIACERSVRAGAHFVKTSTGFNSGGATVEHIRLMRKTVGSDVGVKASGGVRSFEDAVKMIEAGANRLGTSSGLAIIRGAQGSSGY